MSVSDRALLPAGAVALSAALWGLWWLPLRALADAGLSGVAVNAALYGIASLALLPWFWRRRRRLAAGGLLLLGAGGLFGGALLGERVGRVRGVAVVLGLAGAVVLLVLGGGLPLPRSGGDWLGLAAGLLFALSVTLVRKGTAIEGLEQTMVSFATAALLSLLLLALAPPGVPFAPAVLGWAALAALAWLLPVTWLLLWGARFLEPGRAADLHSQAR